MGTGARTGTGETARARFAGGPDAAELGSLRTTAVAFENVWGLMFFILATASVKSPLPENRFARLIRSFWVLKTFPDSELLRRVAASYARSSFFLSAPCAARMLFMTDADADRPRKYWARARSTCFILEKNALRSLTNFRSPCMLVRIAATSRVRLPWRSCAVAESPYTLANVGRFVQSSHVRSTIGTGYMAVKSGAGAVAAGVVAPAGVVAGVVAPAGVVAGVVAAFSSPSGTGASGVTSSLRGGTPRRVRAGCGVVRVPTRLARGRRAG